MLTALPCVTKATLLNIILAYCMSCHVIIRRHFLGLLWVELGGLPCVTSAAFLRVAMGSACWVTM